MNKLKVIKWIGIGLIVLIGVIILFSEIAARETKGVGIPKWMLVIGLITGIVFWVIDPIVVVFRKIR